MTIEVCGNWGRLICDSITGLVISYDRANSDSETLTDGYHTIYKVDIDRYRRRYGSATVIDILHIGYWHKHDGIVQYEQPIQ